MSAVTTRDALREQIASEIHRLMCGSSPRDDRDLMAADATLAVLDAVTAPFGSAMVAGWLDHAAADLARLDEYESSRVKAFRALAAALTERAS